MKKVLIVLTLMLTLAAGAGAASQKHRHHPQTEQTDTASQDAVEAFSDTTGIADPPAVIADAQDEMDSEDMESLIGELISNVSGKDLIGLAIACFMLFFVFFLLPILILVALFYFIHRNRNRKQKLQLAEMAVQNGQPIPDQLLGEKQEYDDTEYQKGLRQCFAGIGLMIFLGYAAGEVGFGIGALVFFIGLGKVVAVKTAGKKQKKANNTDITQYDHD